LSVGEIKIKIKMVPNTENLKQEDLQVESHSTQNSSDKLLMTAMNNIGLNHLDPIRMELKKPKDDATLNNFLVESQLSSYENDTKFSQLEEDSGIHSKSASPDSVVDLDHSHNDSDHEDDADNEVFVLSSTPQNNSKVVPDDSSNFESIELRENPSPSPTLTKTDMVMGIHRLYMSQFSTELTGSGIDNLAFIVEEEPEVINTSPKPIKRSKIGNHVEGISDASSGEFTASLGLIKVNTADSSLSIEEECVLENSYIKNIRDFRRIVQIATLGQQGITVNIFIEVFIQKVSTFLGINKMQFFW
jgi:hypothetical protein